MEIFLEIFYSHRSNAPSCGELDYENVTLLNNNNTFHKKGTTILLVEQNAKRALSIANRAYVLETGRITLEGTGEGLARDERVRKAYLGG